MTRRGFDVARIVIVAAVMVVTGAARPAAADDQDLESPITIDVTLSEAAAVHSTPDVSSTTVGIIPVGGVATVVWSGRRQDGAGSVWLRVLAPLDGWLPGAAAGITTVSLGTVSGPSYATVQPPLTGSGASAGPLPTPAPIGTP
jgi:hypothetical protein